MANASHLKTAGGVVGETAKGVRGSGTVAANSGSRINSSSSSLASLGRRPTAERQCRIAGGQPCSGTCILEYDMFQ